MMGLLLPVVKRFNEAEVEYVVIGGMAVMLYGSSMVTQDVDFCAPLDPVNVARIIRSMEGLNARHFSRPDLPPITEQPERLTNAQNPPIKNLYLRTNLGKVDILGELPGVGSYDEISKSAVEVNARGVRVRALDIDTLISSKRFAGRVRDMQAISELEQIRKEQIEHDDEAS